MRNERELRLAGFRRVAGIDEVGRGSLAGPVVAAAVVLPERHRIRGIRDSKVLTHARREVLYELILDRAEAVGVGCVEVEVRDDGPGMSAEVLARAKAPFFSTKAGQHTGLGLTGCAQMVAVLNGTLVLNSEPSKGTSVRVSIPV
jgi:nitrogen-specific signal transduction histidine kinase